MRTLFLSAMLRKTSLACLSFIFLCLAPSISRADTFTLDPPSLTPFTLSAAVSGGSRGDFITALNNFSITSLGIEGDPALSSFTLFANIYAATGNTRGALLSSSSMNFSDNGLAFYDVPISFAFLSGVDYDISISFGSLPGSSGIFSPQYFSFDNVSNNPANSFSVGPIQVRDGEEGVGGAGNGVAPRLRVVTTTQAQAVPEPATMLLLSTGLIGVAARVARRRRI